MAATWKPYSHVGAYRRLTTNAVAAVQVRVALLSVEVRAASTTLWLPEMKVVEFCPLSVALDSV